MKMKWLRARTAQQVQDLIDEKNVDQVDAIPDGEE